MNSSSPYAGQKTCAFFLLFLFLFAVGHFLYTHGSIEEQTAEVEMEQQLPLLTMHCGLGRLGNQLALFATLHGVAHLNERQVALQKCHVDRLARYFDLSSIPIVNRPPNQEVGYALKSYLRPEDSHVPKNATIFIGHSYPASYTFYDHIAAKIRLLLTLRSKFQQYAQTVLKEATDKHQIKSGTPKQHEQSKYIIVGVHVRLTDYAEYMKKRNGRKIDMNYFRKAMDLFRDKFGPDVLFVVVSDNHKWCQTNFGEFADVFLSPEVSDPGYDMAVMVASNHSIISYGTFSFWCAYLREARGGETVHFDDYLLPGTNFLVVNPYDKVYPNHWIGISSTPPDYWRNFVKS